MRELACIAALVVWGCLGLQAEDLRMELQFPLGEVARVDRSLPVHVTLRAGQPVRGIVRAENGAAAPVSVPVAFGPGTQQLELLVPVPQQDDAMAADIQVTLQTDQQRLVRQRDVEIDWGRNLFVGVLQERAPALPVLRYDHYVNLHRLSPLLLPETATAYDMLDTLCISRGGANRLTAAQAAAITAWVRGGGRLILSPDCVTEFADHNPLLTALGVTSQPRDSGALPVLGYGDKLADGEDETVALPLDFGLLLLQGFPMPTADSVVPAAPSTFPPQDDDPVLNRWLRDLGHTNGAIHADAPFTGYQSPYGLRNDFGEMLADIAGIKPISRLLVMAYLLLFVVLIVIERLLLKRFRRPYWMWGTTLLLVLAFCLGAQQLAAVTRGFRSYHATLTVDDIGLSGQGARTHLTAWFNAQRRPTVFDLPPDHVVRTLAVPGSFRLSPYQGQVQIQAPSWAGTIWSHRGFGRLAPVANSQLQLERGNLVGTVTLRAQRSAGQAAGVGAWLIYGGHAYQMSGQGRDLTPSRIRSNKIDSTADLPFLDSPPGERLFQGCQVTQGQVTQVQGAQGQVILDQAFVPSDASSQDPYLNRVFGLPAPHLDTDTAMLLLVARQAPDAETPDAHSTTLYVIRQLLPVTVP